MNQPASDTFQLNLGQPHCEKTLEEILDKIYA